MHKILSLFLHEASIADEIKIVRRSVPSVRRKQACQFRSLSQAALKTFFGTAPTLDTVQRCLTGAITVVQFYIQLAFPAFIFTISSELVFESEVWLMPRLGLNIFQISKFILIFFLNLLLLQLGTEGKVCKDLYFRPVCGYIFICL